MIFPFPELITLCFMLQKHFYRKKVLFFSKHSAVIAAFGQKFAKTKKIPEEFHRYLINAETARTTGNYDVMAVITIDDAKLQIQRGKNFLELAEKLTGSC